MAITSIAKPTKWFSNKLPFLHLPSSKSHKSPLTPKTITNDNKFLQVFRFFDTDNDGKVSTEELRAYFMSIGENMSYDEVQRVVTEFDSNGDNFLECKEFVKLMEIDSNDGDGDNEEEEELRKAFEMFEVEKGCGCITPKGLRQALKRLGGDEKTEEECEAMIRVFDLDGDGVLDFHEFQKMMT